jgi:hypothetical protein
MRWHEEGACENDHVMVHPSDNEAWKVIDDFDADFTKDVRNVRIGLVRDGLSLYNMSTVWQNHLRNEGFVF